MATTSTRVEFLINGVRDTAGAVVASGKVRAYEPGTSTPATIYSDAACSSAITQPLTLNAAGQGTVYTLNAVRLTVKDSTETTTYVDDIFPLVRAQSVYATVTGINSGAETTLHAILGDIGASFGSGFNYQESATATARPVADVLRGHAIQAEDYGVTADGSTDDTTALQNAINRVETLVGTGGATARLLLPAGTIKITSAVTIDTAKLSIEGQGRGVSIISQTSTSANGLNVTLGGAADAKLFLKGFTVTAATTSSGTAINVSVGNKVVIEDVGVALFRTGFDSSAVTGTDFRHCFVDSTDDNASAIGMNLGAAARAIRPEVTSATDNGTGIKLSGVDGRVYDAYTTNFATAIHANAARAIIRDPNVSGPTTGISLAAANGMVDGGIVTGCTTGVSVGAVAACIVTNMVGSSNTTDLTVNASATLFAERNNAFTTVTNSATTPKALPLRLNPSVTTSASASPTLTPDISGGKNVNVFVLTNAAGTSPTLAAHDTATLAIGDMLYLVLSKDGANDASFTINAQYKAPNGTDTIFGGGHTLTSERTTTLEFQWTGTVWRCLHATLNAVL